MKGLELLEKNKINHAFLVFSLSMGLRSLVDGDLEEEMAEEMMQKFGFSSKEEVEQLIEELDDLSWEK